MVVDANETGVGPTDQATAVIPSEKPESEPGAAPTAEPAEAPKQRTWSAAKNPVTPEQTEAARRMARQGGAAVARFIVAAARFGTRSVKHAAAGIEAIPPVVRTLALFAILMLLAIVGSIALQGAMSLLCIVVLVPVSSFVLGALGYRWFSGLGGQQAPARQTAGAQPSDLYRSVEYVDNKLTFALNAFGEQRHQSAIIAIFQAKTALGLTLGTELDTASQIDALLSIEDRGSRPRIRAGSKSPFRDADTLAAS